MGHLDPHHIRHYSDHMARFQRPGGIQDLLRHGGIPLFSVFGIRVVVHYTWFIIAALITWVLAAGWFPGELPGRPASHYIILGAITAFFFFASVLLHELSHSIVAVRNGIPVRRITLFLFGGVAEILREPSDPGTELKVALAGPAMSALIAVSCQIAVVLMGVDSARPGLREALIYLRMTNTMLLVFNILPGLPLDGGRVLRAIVWRVTGDLRRATRVASASGQAIAGVIVLAGVASMLLFRSFMAGLWIILIALFLRQAAGAGYRQLVMRDAIAGIRVASVLTPDPVTVGPDVTLSELIEQYLLRYHFTTYPVMSDGRPVGLITLRGVKRIRRDLWAATRVVDVMMPITQEVCLRPDDDIPTAISRMDSLGQSRLPVVGADGELVGIVSRRDVMAYLQIRSDLALGRG
jgi:Zn-dependent protease/CBS domain-containing protein